MIIRNLPESYFELLLKVEGGYSDDKYDRGGKTNFGISTNFLKRLGSKYGITDVTELTEDLAYLIYNNEFWKKYYCYEYPFYLDYVIFDSFVNHGFRGGKYRLKELLYRLANAYPNLSRKIIINPVKVELLNYDTIKTYLLQYYMETAVSPLLFADELLLIRMNFYYRIIIKYSSQERFLKGWIRRLKVIMDELPNLK